MQLYKKKIKPVLNNNSIAFEFTCNISISFSIYLFICLLFTHPPFSFGHGVLYNMYSYSLYNTQTINYHPPYKKKRESIVYYIYTLCNSFLKNHLILFAII